MSEQRATNYCNSFLQCAYASAQFDAVIFLTLAKQTYKYSKDQLQ